MHENDELFRPSWCPGSSPMEVPVGFAALPPFIPRREVLDLKFSVQTDKKNHPNERPKPLQRIAQNVTKSMDLIQALLNPIIYEFVIFFERDSMTFLRPSINQRF